MEKFSKVTFFVKNKEIEELHWEKNILFLYFFLTIQARERNF